MRERIVVESDDIIFVPGITHGDDRDDNRWESGQNWVIGIDQNGIIFIIKAQMPCFDVEIPNDIEVDLKQYPPGIYKADLEVRSVESYCHDYACYEYETEEDFINIEPLMVFAL